jgi:hypothetical protein
MSFRFSFIQHAYVVLQIANLVASVGGGLAQGFFSRLTSYPLAKIMTLSLLATRMPGYQETQALQSWRAKITR